MSAKARRFWPLLCLLVAADCTTKRLAETHLAPAHIPHEVLGEYLQFTLAHNPGAAFSISVGPSSRVVFSILAVVVLAVLCAVSRTESLIAGERGVVAGGRWCVGIFRQTALGAWRRGFHRHRCRVVPFLDVQLRRPRGDDGRRTARGLTAAAAGKRARGRTHCLGGVAAMTSLILALSLSATCTAIPPNEVPGDVDYAKLFASGVPFAEFLSKQCSATSNGTLTNYERATVPDALLARAARVTGTWNVLVVAVDSCSDSVSTIPYIAKFVEAMPNVTLRIVDAKAGKEVMEQHRTPDDRAATPTLILLDSAYVERGCWIERPRELQSWITGEKKNDPKRCLHW